MARAQAAAAAAPTLYALGVIVHDNVRYEAGEALPPMDAQQADALAAAGVVSKVRPLEDAEPAAEAVAETP